MKSQRIDLSLLLRILLIGITPILFACTLALQSLVLTRIALVIVWIVQIFLLYRYLKRSEQRLRQAVQLITGGEEYQVLSKSSLSKVHEDVLEEINCAISIFRDLKIANEANLLFFRKVMENVPSGVIVMQENENFEFVNTLACKLLDIKGDYSLIDMERIRPGFSFWLREISGGHNVIDLDFPERSVKLSVSVTEILVRDKALKIFSIKDIKKEVDSKEMETWHNMLRILSHEVVNSVSPITLSAMSMRRNLTELQNNISISGENKKLMSDIDTGLSAISERGKGLNEFVESVQKLTKIPDPETECITLKKLVKESLEIMRVSLQENKIVMTEQLENISVSCDRRLISHVLINLVKNSMEAFEGQSEKTIRISGRREDDSVVLIVEDNGPGIAEDMRKQVFSPFFSTKSEGSGLGLSFISRVMKMHNGDISLWSQPGKTKFTLTLPVHPGV